MVGKRKSLAAGLARGFVRVGRTSRPTPSSQAGGLGFEPRLMDPESTVLPLDEPPLVNTIYVSCTNMIIAGIFSIDKLETGGIRSRTLLGLLDPAIGPLNRLKPALIEPIASILFHHRLPGLISLPVGLQV